MKVTSIARLDQLLRMLGMSSAQANGNADDLAGRRHAPVALKSRLREMTGLGSDDVVVSGPLPARLVMVRLDGERWAACTLGQFRLGELPLPAQISRGMRLFDPDASIGFLQVDADALHHLLRPRVTLVALYHPENFPLPRFALGVSDIARAIRSGYMGEVHLLDMQLDGSSPEVADQVAASEPDIVGISATFGQHDALLAMLEHLGHRLRRHTELILGGSLSALNEALLLQRYPTAIVARGPGEHSMIDLVAHWHGNLARSQIRNIGFTNDATLEITRKTSNREYAEIVPELDLLDRTLQCNGVMQLESSRGCTHACSFCPREHKGSWHGDDPSHLEMVVDEILPVFEAHRRIARKVFLVDEEFIGHDRGGRASTRARSVAEVLDQRGFRWETSSRIDQVHRPDRSVDWHLERIELWRYLRDRGLDRCLFGVESGVDSILRRFNKMATARQNVIAIRLLTALEVPIRCTYITFDQLMSLDELIESYQFQGRDDLALSVPSTMKPAELYESVHDDEFAHAHSSNVPFYEHISYMLVSMECLIGSPYLRLVERAGLARETLPSMGRRNAVFHDPRIGMLSDWAQRWVDRNFSFDYTLKSVEKVSTGDEKSAARIVRRQLKASAYVLLGRLLYLCTLNPEVLPHAEANNGPFLSEHRASRLGNEPGRNEELLRAVVDAQFTELIGDVEEPLLGLYGVLESRRRLLVDAELNRWLSRQRWDLINPPEHCVS